MKGFATNKQTVTPPQGTKVIGSPPDRAKDDAKEWESWEEYCADKYAQEMTEAKSESEEETAFERYIERIYQDKAAEEKAEAGDSCKLPARRETLQQELTDLDIDDLVTDDPAKVNQVLSRMSMSKSKQPA